jgi:hypothetical protein
MWVDVARIGRGQFLSLREREFVEAARTLAAKTLAEGGADLLSRARFMLRRAVGRVPTDDEVGVVADLVERHRQLLAADAPAADAMLAIGAMPQPAGVDRVLAQTMASVWSSIF